MGWDAETESQGGLNIVSLSRLKFVASWLKFGRYPKFFRGDMKSSPSLLPSFLSPQLVQINVG